MRQLWERKLFAAMFTLLNWATVCALRAACFPLRMVLSSFKSTFDVLSIP